MGIATALSRVVQEVRDAMRCSEFVVRRMFRQNVDQHADVMQSVNSMCLQLMSHISVLSRQIEMMQVEMMQQHMQMSRQTQMMQEHMQIVSRRPQSVHTGHHYHINSNNLHLGPLPEHFIRPPHEPEPERPPPIFVQGPNRPMPFIQPERDVAVEQ